MRLPVCAACMVAALAVFSLPAHAQEETTVPADQSFRRQAPGMIGRGAETTTASFEQYWKQTQEGDLKAAEIPEEKIEQLKQMELEARMALARGERPDFAGLRDKRREILTPEEMQRISEVRRAKREGIGAQGEGTTTAPQFAIQPEDSQTTPTAASDQP